MVGAGMDARTTAGLVTGATVLSLVVKWKKARWLAGLFLSLFQV